MSRQEQLNPFGQLILGLPGEIAERRQEIVRHEIQIQQKTSLRDSLDINKLSRGELTGDPKLDAALLLSFHGSKEEWPQVTRAVYDMLSEEDRRLQEWEGGPILHNDISQSASPYCGALNFGTVEGSSHLLIEFSGKSPDVLDSGVRILIPDFDDLTHLNFTHRTQYQDGKLDITEMFHPNLGMGRVEVDRRLRYPEDQRSLGGIYLGEREIRERVEEFTSHLERFSMGYQRTYEGYSTEIRAHTDSFLAGVRVNG